MPRGIATPKQLAMMVTVLDAYSRAFGIYDEVRREELAFQIVLLFEQGYRDEGSLLKALSDSEVARDGRQPH